MPRSGVSVLRDERKAISKKHKRLFVRKEGSRNHAPCASMTSTYTSINFLPLAFNSTLSRSVTHLNSSSPISPEP